MCLTAVFTLSERAYVTKCGVDSVSVSWNKLKLNTRALRSFPASFHGSLILADACFAFKLMLDKAKNFTTKKPLPWYCNQNCSYNPHTPTLRANHGQSALKYGPRSPCGCNMIYFLWSHISTGHIFLIPLPIKRLWIRLKPSHKKEMIISVEQKGALNKAIDYIPLPCICPPFLIEKKLDGSQDKNK